MSSHHIVRDEQEPALFILDAQSACLETVQSLLEWSPTVIALDHSVEKALSWGIKLDIVVCRHALLDKFKGLLQDQVPIKFLTYNDGENPSLTVLYFLISSKYEAVNMVGAFDIGGLQGFFQFSGRLSIVCFSKTIKWSLISTHFFKKWVVKGLSFILDPKIELMSVTGLDKLTIDGHTRLRSLADGMVNIGATPPFWVGEELVG